MKGIDLHFNDCTHQGGHGPDGRGARWAAQVLGQSERSQGGEPKALTTGDSKGKSQVTILFQLTTSCIQYNCLGTYLLCPRLLPRQRYGLRRGSYCRCWRHLRYSSSDLSHQAHQSLVDLENSRDDLLYELHRLGHNNTRDRWREVQLH